MKYFAIFILAIAACQVHPIEAQPREFDSLILDITGIIKTVGKNTINGIIESQPYIDDLGRQLSANMGVDIKKWFSNMNKTLETLVNRTIYFEQEINNASQTIHDECGYCVQKSAAALDVILEPTEKKLWTAFRDVFDASNYQYGINITFDYVINYWNKTDEALTAGVACIKRGSTSVDACLISSLNDWTGDRTELLYELQVFGYYIANGFRDFIIVLTDSFYPILNEFKNNTEPILQYLNDCVASNC